MPSQTNVQCLKKRRLAVQCKAGKITDYISTAQRTGTAQAAVANALACSPLLGIYHRLVALAAPSPSHCHGMSLAAANKVIMKYNCSIRFPNNNREQLA